MTEAPKHGEKHKYIMYTKVGVTGSTYLAQHLQPQWWRQCQVDAASQMMLMSSQDSG